jgi:hypothetical protein
LGKSRTRSPFAIATDGLTRTHITVYAAAEPDSDIGAWSKAMVFLDADETPSLRHAVTGAELEHLTDLVYSTKGRAEAGRTSVARDANRAVGGGNALAGSTWSFARKSNGVVKSVVKWHSTLLQAMKVLTNADSGKAYTNYAIGVVNQTAEMRRHYEVVVTAWWNDLQ